MSAKREFEADLIDYLTNWQQREENGAWKFNKVLQVTNTSQ